MLFVYVSCLFLFRFRLRFIELVARYLQMLLLSWQDSRLSRSRWTHDDNSSSSVSTLTIAIDKSRYCTLLQQSTTAFSSQLHSTSKSHMNHSPPISLHTCIRYCNSNVHLHPTNQLVLDCPWFSTNCSYSSFSQLEVTVWNGLPLDTWLLILSNTIWRLSFHTVSWHLDIAAQCPPIDY